MVFDELGCRRPAFGEVCDQAKNGAAYLFYLFPTGLMLFAPQAAPAWVPWVGLVVCVLACHWLMRRFLPERVLLLQAVALVAVAWLLNYGLFCLFLWEAAYRTTGHLV